MPNPKRKFSKSRTAHRRSVYYNRLDAPATVECPNCGNRAQLHRACPNCGHYRGRQVVEVKGEEL
jgi:large subunit ribosomal protein L32